MSKDNKHEMTNKKYAQLGWLIMSAIAGFLSGNWGLAFFMLMWAV